MKDALNYRGLTGSVNYSPEDGIFFGKIEGIRDLVTFEGTTLEELERSFHFMVDEEFGTGD